MTRIFAVVLLCILPLFGFQSLHKYYTSVTEIEYVPKKESVQIITRIFIDDFESVLKERYDESIMLNTQEENTLVDVYIKKYLKAKMKITINNQPAELNFIGKQYDTDMVKCYLEIEGVTDITSFKVSNTVLFDVFEEQQNIIKTNINSKQKSFTLTQQQKYVSLTF